MAESSEVPSLGQYGQGDHWANAWYSSKAIVVGIIFEIQLNTFLN